MTLSVQDITHRVLDVRPLIKGGVEPFNAIMEAVDGLLPGQSLLLIAPFKPARFLVSWSEKAFRKSGAAGGWRLASPVQSGDGRRA